MSVVRHRHRRAPITMRRCAGINPFDNDVTGQAVGVPRILVIDSYDSFVYNLVQYLGELGAEPRVYVATTRSPSTRRWPSSPTACCCRPARADRRTPASSARRSPRSPSAACRCSACASATRRSATSTARRSCGRPQLMHGKTSPIEHDGDGVFAGLPVAADGDPLPLAGDRPGHACPTASRSRLAPPTARHGRCATVSAGRGRAVPPGEHPHRRRPRPARATSSPAPPETCRFRSLRARRVRAGAVVVRWHRRCPVAASSWSSSCVVVVLGAVARPTTRATTVPLIDRADPAPCSG